MLDPTDPLTRVWLSLAFAAVVAVLVIRAIRRDRREFQRFKRYRSTRRRQAIYRKWLIQSFAIFGGLAVAVLLLAGVYVAPLLEELQAWWLFSAMRDAVGANVIVSVALAVVAVSAVIVLTIFGVRAARVEGDVPAIGDIRAMLPRNRHELWFGALISVNAGVVEELLFRLALPALIFGVTGSTVFAVLGSVAIFGLLHAYQGAAGVIGATILGALFLVAYVLSGSILVAIVLHALIDLRTLVVIPVGVFGVHRVDGGARRSRAPVPDDGAADAG